MILSSTEETNSNVYLPLIVSGKQISNHMIIWCIRRFTSAARGAEATSRNFLVLEEVADDTEVS